MEVYRASDAVASPGYSGPANQVAAVHAQIFECDISLSGSVGRHPACPPRKRGRLHVRTVGHHPRRRFAHLAEPAQEVRQSRPG